MIFLTDLFPHQKPAVDKLKNSNVGALFMEMGTGKTRTALQLIQKRLETGEVTKVLWMCPCSVKENLRVDIARHTGSDQEGLIRIEGLESISGSGRLFLELHEYADSKTFLVIDESNMCKNPRALRSKRLEKIAEKCIFKLILNGTPMSKNEADIFEQFYLLDWRILGYRSYYSFAANHLVYREIKDEWGKKRRTDQVVNVLDKDYLAERIAPFTYQVKKQECMDLPRKRHFTKTFSLTSSQYEHYDTVKYDLLADVDEFRSDTIYRLFTGLQLVTSGRRITSLKLPMQSENFFDVYEENPRVRALREQILEIGDEKIIVFCRYQSEIEEVSQMLDDEGLSYAEFTGRLNQKKRQESLSRFRGDSQILIANKACGAYGLNLQFCRNIIFYDNDFDLATRLQAEDRVHRIGQDQEVRIYDIVAMSSIDQMVTENLTNKESMLKAFKAMVEKWKKEKAERDLDKEFKSGEELEGPHLKRKKKKLS
jgi:SNF2 family DNA or RNA helicase